MWEWFNNRGLRTFCHLRDERSFDFGNELHSLICHRCSGIYSAFLLFFIIGLIFNYRGYYLKNIQSRGIFITGACLLALSPLQVLLQKIFSDVWFTGGSSRFIIGSLTGLGLLHLYYGLLENTPHKKAKTWFPFIFLAFLFIHTLLSHQFPFWINTGSILGLILVYLVMNHLVVESLIPKFSQPLKLATILIFVALEWSFLYWNNILRHQHG